MAVVSGIVQVGPTATRVYEPTAAGYVVLQSLGGTVPVQVGGVGVTFNGVGGGIQLAVGSGVAGVAGLAGQPPTPFPIAHYGSLADADDGIYAVSQSGTVPVAYVAGT